MGGPVTSDESKLSFGEQLKLFGGVYWVANWMELVERFAYYGVRVVLPTFMVASFAENGPEFDHVQKGTIYSVWAIVQSFVPILSGGFADRYGYKLAIAISTVLKIVGYLLMGYCIVLAESLAGMPLSEARPQGIDHTYGIFFAGAMFLATGTAIFKPGVQGLIANQMPKEAASLGWGLFYQMVNIGGFLGPFLAGYLRVLDWNYVFLLCSAAIALNFIPLFFFREPARDHDDDGTSPLGLLYDSIVGLLEPRLFFFTISFAGFWLMFYQLFDILPNFIDDWVDSRAIATMLQSTGISVPTVDGNLTQEWMINFNALLISLLAFAMGYLTGKMSSLWAIIVGIGVSAVAIYGLGLSMNGWIILAAIGLFSIGEMAASPTKMRFLASIAPPGKEGLYMGYSNFTVGIGWSVGSVVAGEMYETGGDKVVLARRYLTEKANVAADKVSALAKDEVLPFFEKSQNVDAWGARELLWETYSPQSMWLVFTAIGVFSMFAIVAYNYGVKRADSGAKPLLGMNGHQWIRMLLVPIVGVFAYFSYVKVTGLIEEDVTVGQAILRQLGLILNGLFFTLMLLVSLTIKPDDGSQTRS